MVGGYNFATGEVGNGIRFTSGDIFIDIDGNAKYGATISPISVGGYQSMKNTFGWDYAISLDFTKSEYSVYQIDAGDYVKTPYFTANRPSAPFEYVSGGTLLSAASGTFTYQTGQNDAAVGFGLTGGLHNVVGGIDLSFLGETDFTAHFTMGCGNDMLIGKGTIQVPEPGSFSLMFLGLATLAGALVIRRKNK